MTAISVNYEWNKTYSGISMRDDTYNLLIKLHIKMHAHKFYKKVCKEIFVKIKKLHMVYVQKDLNKVWKTIWQVLTIIIKKWANGMDYTALLLYFEEMRKHKNTVRQNSFQYVPCNITWL